MPRRTTVARKTKYADQLTGTALTLNQFTNKLMYGGKRHLAHRILEDATGISLFVTPRTGLVLRRATD